MIKKIYLLLEIPFIYRLAQIILAPGFQQKLQPLHQKIFSEVTSSVLDIGCGPKLTTPEPNGLLAGVDINESYIKSYSGSISKDAQIIFNKSTYRSRVGFVASADHLPFVDGSFDEARSNALFHHLPDKVANKTIQEMFRCVRPGGRLIIIDAVWPLKNWRRPLAWLLLRLDRGSNVRSQEEMLTVVQEACPGPWKWERHTITYVGVEFLFLQLRKP